MPGDDLMITEGLTLTIIYDKWFKRGMTGFLPKFNAKSAVTFQTRGEIVLVELWNITTMFQM